MKVTVPDLIFWLVALALYAAAWFVLRKHRRDVTYAGYLGLITAGFFWRVLFGGAFIPEGGGDMAAILYPVYHFAQVNLRQGIIPLWNPNLYAGIPFVGHIQSGPFYPPNLLLFFLTPEVTYRSLEYLLIAHFWLAGVCMYAFLRGLNSAESPGGNAPQLARPAALLGAVVFMFNDFNITHIGNPNMVAVGAWLPLVMLCYQRAVSRRRAWYAMLAGAVTGMAYLAGHIQPFLYILFAVGLYAAYEILLDWRNWAKTPNAKFQAPYHDRRPLASFTRLLVYPASLLGLYLIFTISIGAISLVPNVEMSSQSLRESLSYEDAAAYSLPPALLTGMFVPGIFGRGPNIHWGPWDRVEVGYAGILPLVLAALGLMWRKGRMPRFLLLLGIVSLALAMGLYNVVHGWLFLIPGYSQIRVPARFVFLLDFAIAGLAAYGFDALLHPLPRRLHSAWRKVAPVLAVILGAVLLVLAPLVFVAMALSQSQDISIFNRIANGFNGVMEFALLLAISIVLLLARRSRWLSRPVWSLAVVLFVFLDLASLGAYLDSGETDPTANFQHPQTFAFLHNDAEPFRIETPEDSWFQWQPNLGLIARLDDAAGIYNPLLLQRYDRYWKIAIGRDNALYDLLNTKYLVAKKDEKVAAKFTPVFAADAQVKVWLNGKALPRAFMVYRSQVVANGDAAFAAITQGEFDPAQTIVLEGGEALNGSAPSAPMVGFAGRSTNSVELDVTSAADGYLFLGDTYYPGWKATIDGQDAPVVRADYLFRAVKVTAGTHHVRFWFDPLSWKIGVVLTSLGLMGIVAGWWILRPRRMSIELKGVQLS